MSIPHQATPKMLPPAQMVGTAADCLQQEDAAPSGSSCVRLVLKEVVAVEGVFSRLPEAVCPSRRS